MCKQGVPLTIQEPSEINRQREPVTSGVPLPEGIVKNAEELCLLGPDNKPVPCQFTPLCRWPSSARCVSPGNRRADKSEGKPDASLNPDDGAIKWVLLDFQADVAASNSTKYTLCMAGKALAPDRPVRVETNQGVVTLETGHAGGRSAVGPAKAENLSAKDGSAFGGKLETGSLKLGISTNVAGLISSLVLDGRHIVSPTNPIQAVLVDGSNKVYRASRPRRVVTELAGPMRATVLVQGEFVSDDGGRIHGGKVGYDLRVHAYAGKPYVKLAFTLKNDGWYGYRNEGGNHPRQWLFFKSLRLDVPLTLQPGVPIQPAFSGIGPVSAVTNDVSLVQWYRYPCVNSRYQPEKVFDVEDELAREKPAGIEESRKGFYWWLENDGRGRGSPGKLDGWTDLRAGQEVVAGMAARRFWQNFPRGFSVGPLESSASRRLSFLMFPEDGFWPRTEAAHKAKTYQFEGGRHKTAELLLWFGKPDGDPSQMTRILNQPLVARAATEWYRDTAAVLPLAGSAARSGRDAHGPDDAGLAEAMERYDRLQRAKVRIDFGDPAGPNYPSDRDYWGKASIPALQDRAGDVFSGWMNYGDLIWPFGYCSLYYDWPYALLQQYLRLGDREFLDVAEDMIRHRYDIDQYHVEETAPYLGGFQRAERGEHGHISRQEEVQGRNSHWEANCVPSHTWCRGLLLHWALTGDPRSLDAAEQNGRAYRRFFYDQQKLGEKQKLPYGEFRTPAWAMENWLALYEYTGRKEYLEWAGEVFDKTLLAMEKDNGSRGHILKDGRQSGQFTAYVVEPVCRLHQWTGRRDVIEFLGRVLDWQRQNGSLRGLEKDGHYYPTLWKEHWDFDPALEEIVGMGASVHYSILFCDGYAYLSHVLGRRNDRDFARKIFREFMFFYGFPNGGDKNTRTPLGYHFRGSAFGPTPKIHAFSGRYGLLFLSVEEDR